MRIAGTVKLLPERLESFSREILIHLGLTDEEAGSSAQVLVAADLRGIDSHGVSRLPIYARRLMKGLINPRPERKILSQKGAIGILDADNGMGAPAAIVATRMAMEKAREYGLGGTVVGNTNHFGIAAYYAMLPVEKDMLGMAMTNTSPLMVPFGGQEKILGTNPVAVAVPGGSYPPVVLDMATTGVARGKLELAKQRGEAIPEGWGVDSRGEPTTDPDKALSGALLPLGGPKGSGMAIIIDILCGVLTGSAFGCHIGSLFGDLDRPQGIGNFFLAIDIGFYRDVRDFKREMEEYRNMVKSSRPARGFDEVFMPGEIEQQAFQKRRVDGIPLGEPLRMELKELAQEIGVAADWLDV